MDARVPSLSNWPTRNLKPARPLDDIELVQFHSDVTFRSARERWRGDLARLGSPDFANMFVVCWLVSSKMGFDKGAVCFAEQGSIATELGWGIATVRRALDLAVAWGWLTKVRQRGSSNIYRMSFSRSVKATLELEIANRKDDWTIETTKRKLARNAARSIRSDHSQTSVLSDDSDQMRANGSLRSDHLSSSISSSDDPLQPSSERLGEGEQDIGEGAEQKKALLDDVISALGRGDLDEGQRIAAGLNPARLDWLVSLADREGMVGAHQAIVEARKSASPRH
jgi:hypothetical protein